LPDTRTQPARPAGLKLAEARQAAFATLLAVDRGAWSAEALAAKSQFLQPRDAALASDIVFGTLRRKGELDFVMGKCSSRPVVDLDVNVRIALEMALYQLMFLDRVPPHAVVNDAVELTRRAGEVSAVPFVNAVLRRALREQPEAPELASTPDWILRSWTRKFGSPAARAIALASLVQPRRYVRVGGGVPPEGAVATDVAGCYELPSGSPAGCRFQDIGSQAVVPLLELRPGQTFLDVCAAPGNKTAQALETSLKAVACELHPSRARGLRSLGIPVVVADATKPLPFSTRFERILVDAPCTGTGTLARNPEIKWRLTPDDLPDLHSRQLGILRNALERLAPGGLLVYATCSLEREENEDVVAASGARVIKTMQRLPGRDPGDGFFAAVMTR